MRTESLQRWGSELETSASLAEAPTREQVTVAGVVQKIRIDPREGSGSIEATLSDGTAELVARWLGRQTLSGISLGAALMVEGIIGTGKDGRPQILNPEYHLIEGPGRG